MKLSDHTLAVLKNFAAINPSIVINPGRVQRTKAGEHVLAEAELEEDFPVVFGVDDLNLFLGNITTLKNPELEFTDKSVTMKADGLSTTFYSHSPQFIDQPPDKKMVMKNPDVTFEISNSTMSKITKLAAMNDLDFISIVGRKGKCFLQAHDETDTSNQVVTEVCDYEGDDFINKFERDTFQMLPDDYKVELKKGRYARFESKTKPIYYCFSMQIE